MATIATEYAAATWTSAEVATATTTTTAVISICNRRQIDVRRDMSGGPARWNAER